MPAPSGQIVSKRPVIHNHALALTLILTVTLIAGMLPVQPVRAASSLPFHNSIVIMGNAGFTNPQNGVTGGSGTKQDPWIISGWSFTSYPSSPAILVMGYSTDYFVIRNVEIQSPPGATGIYFSGTERGSVENSTFIGGASGIGLLDSSNVTIRQNKVVNSTISVNDNSAGPLSNNLVVANNTLVNSSIQLDSCSFYCNLPPPNMTVTGNTITGTISQGCAICTFTKGTTITNNTISGTGNGIGLLLSSNSVVKDNTIKVPGYDITMSSTNSTVFTGNKMQGQGIGIFGPNSFPPLPDYPSYYDSHRIDATNIVNGVPVLYYSKCASNLNISNTKVSQLIIASCSNITLDNLSTIGSVSAGILLAHVAQTRVENSRIDSNLQGLVITRSNGVNVSNSDLSNNIQAIYATYSTNLTVTHDSFTNEAQTLDEKNVTNTTINNNLFRAIKNEAFSLDGVTNATLSQNEIQNTGGLYIHDSSHILIQENRATDNNGTMFNLYGANTTVITQNWISDNHSPAIVVHAANGLNVTANTVLRNITGISIDPAVPADISNVFVYHNNFVYNLVDQADYYSNIHVNWDNGYPSGGNFWGEYTAIDNCSGSLQNVCPNPDGIGDTYYYGIIQAQVDCPGCSGTPSLQFDHYPLVKPYGNITQETVPPQWPSGTKLFASAVSYSTVSLAWTSATDDMWISSYQIIENGVVIAKVPGSQLYYTVTGLKSSTTYQFRIEATDPGGFETTTGPSNAFTTPPYYPNGTGPPPGPGQQPPSLPAVNAIVGLLIVLVTGDVVGAVLLYRTRTRFVDTLNQ